MYRVLLFISVIAFSGGLYAELASPTGLVLGGEVERSTSHIHESAIPWDDLANQANRTFSEEAKKHPEEAAHIASAFRLKRLVGGPEIPADGFKFGYLMIAPGTVYPAHIHPAPEMYHILSGETEWIVNGEKFKAGPGSSVVMQPNQSHELVVLGDKPMKAVWAHWIPAGADVKRLQSGYKLLAPFPPLPAKAQFPKEITFFPIDEIRSESIDSE